MKCLRFVLLVVLFVPVVAMGYSEIHPSGIGGPILIGTIPPPSCSAGEKFYDTDALEAENSYECVNGVFVLTDSLVTPDMTAWRVSAFDAVTEDADGAWATAVKAGAYGRTVVVNQGGDQSQYVRFCLETTDTFPQGGMVTFTLINTLHDIGTVESAAVGWHAGATIGDAYTAQGYMYLVRDVDFSYAAASLGTAVMQNYPLPVGANGCYEFDFTNLHVTGGVDATVDHFAIYQTPTGRPQTFLLLADSIGSNQDSIQTNAAILAAYPGADPIIYNASHAGWRMLNESTGDLDSISERCEQNMDLYKDLGYIIIQSGINDNVDYTGTTFAQWTAAELAEYKQGFRDCRDAALARGIIPIIVSSAYSSEVVDPDGTDTSAIGPVNDGATFPLIVENAITKLFWQDTTSRPTIDWYKMMFDDHDAEGTQYGTLRDDAHHLSTAGVTASATETARGLAPIYKGYATEPTSFGSLGECTDCWEVQIDFNTTGLESTGNVNNVGNYTAPAAAVDETFTDLIEFAAGATIPNLSVRLYSNTRDDDGAWTQWTSIGVTIPTDASNKWSLNGVRDGVTCGNFDEVCFVRIGGLDVERTYQIDLNGACRTGSCGVDFSPTFEIAGTVNWENPRDTGSVLTWTGLKPDSEGFINVRSWGSATTGTPRTWLTFLEITQEIPTRY